MDTVMVPFGDRPQHFYVRSLGATVTGLVSELVVNVLVCFRCAPTAPPFTRFRAG